MTSCVFFSSSQLAVDMANGLRFLHEKRLVLRALMLRHIYLGHNNVFFTSSW